MATIFMFFNYDKYSCLLEVIYKVKIKLLPGNHCVTDVCCVVATGVVLVSVYVQVLVGNAYYG